MHSTPRNDVQHLLTTFIGSGILESGTNEEKYVRRNGDTDRVGVKRQLKYYASKVSESKVKARTSVRQL